MNHTSQVVMCVCVRVVSLFLMVCQEEQKPISCSAEFPDAAGGAGGIP